MTNLKAVAEKLVDLSRGDALPEIVRLFKEEYGIDIIALMTEDLNDEPLRPEIVAESVKKLEAEMQKCNVVVLQADRPHKSKPYVPRKIMPHVPRKIGKPCKRPNNLRRRR